MASSRGAASGALWAALVVFLAAGGVALYFLVTYRPMHTDAAAIPTAPGEAAAARYKPAVDEATGRARALLVKKDVPGLSVAVAVDGAIVWAEGVGYADIDRTPVTTRTRYRLGALSKPVTAAAVALLHDRGQLNLDLVVQRYVRAYPLKKWNVTTRQLMGDVAGVHRIRGDGNDAMPTEHCATVDEAVKLLRDDPLLFEPGTAHRYSIWGWVLVSAAVEGAAVEPFETFMARDVFAPLGMDRTVVQESDAKDEPMPAHAPREVLGLRMGVEDAPPPDYSCLAGAGAFLSTPSDLVRLGSAFIKPGYLTAETIATFTTPTQIASGSSTTYALGWTVGTVQLAGKPVRMVSHRGNPRGGSAALLIFQDLGLAVAVTANLTDLASVNAFALEVAEAFAKRK